MKIYGNTYQTIMHMTSTDISSLTDATINPILQEASRLANNRRKDALTKMEKSGIRASIYADKQPNVSTDGGNMSYRYFDFDYDPNESLNRKKARLASIKRFLSDETSTYEGIKRVFETYRETVTASLHGGKVDAYMDELERRAKIERWSPAKLKREKRKKIHELSEEAIKYYDDAEKRKILLQDKEIVDKYWEVYRKIREDNNNLVYGSDSVRDIIYQEVTDNPYDTPAEIQAEVLRRLKREVYLGRENTGHNSFESRGGYRNGGNN